MAPRGQVQLTVTFGPSPSPLFRRAVAYAAAYATTAAEIAPGVWRSAFTLGRDPEPYGRAWRLILMVGEWKATEVEVGGSPEAITPVVAMLSCARGWLRSQGECRAPFPAGPWPKCELCPLYDPGWAAESFASPGFWFGITPPSGGLDYLMPDYPPEELE